MTILEMAKAADEANAGDYLIKCLMVGKTGSGKTTSTAFTLPKPVLVLDYDNRAESLAGFEGIKIIKIVPDVRKPMRWREGVEKLTDELWTAVREEKLEYKSILEAGLTSMNRMAMYWALLLDPKRGLGGSPAMQHYGPQIKNLQDHILSMLALPVNYVLEAHYELVKDEEEGRTTFLPLLFGQKARTELPGMFNECYHCYHVTDEKEHKEKYFWHTSGFGRFDFMKSSLNQLGKYWKDPIEVDLSVEPAGFQKLLQLRFKKKEVEQDGIQ